MSFAQYKLKTSFGNIYLVANETSLIKVSWNCGDYPLIKSLTRQEGPMLHLSMAVQQLEEYFRGERKHFNITLDLLGSEFQKKVWKEIAKIPFGETISYAELAKKIGHPNAVRAVGTATGLNHFCLLIPCHRVIKTGGEIGNYSGGNAIKKDLLELESKYFDLNGNN
jgi:methylated-DNA-[protein]-cysteine S-methyltransferase